MKEFVKTDEHDPMEDLFRVGEWFYQSGNGSNPEKEVETSVQKMIQGFLRGYSVEDGVSTSELAGQFQETIIPEEPFPPKCYMEFLNEQVVKASTNTASPSYIGHMTSALPAYVRPVASLIAALNQNTVKMETSRSTTFLERQTLGMLHRLVYGKDAAFYQHHVQFPSSTLGIMTSGGTVANITALWCARNQYLGAHGNFRGVEAEGMAAALRYYGYRNAVVIGSASMHYSFEKAADLLGIGTNNLIRVPVDSQGRMDIKALGDILQKHKKEGSLIISIVGIAGTTNSGSIDSLEDIAKLAKGYGAHFHVDAAWGGALLFSNRHRLMIKGIEQADSVTLDGHKQLYLPMGVSLCLLKKPCQADSIRKQAQYIIRAGSADLGSCSLEGSRPAASLYLHAALYFLGRRGLEDLVDYSVGMAGYFAAMILKDPAFELLSYPQTNIVLYRYIPERYRSLIQKGNLTGEQQMEMNRQNQSLQKEQREKGMTFVSRTTIRHHLYPDMDTVALRAVISNPLTDGEHLQKVLNDQKQIMKTRHRDEMLIHTG